MLSDEGRWMRYEGEKLRVKGGGVKDHGVRAER